MRKIIILLFISLTAYCQKPVIVSSTNLGGNGNDNAKKIIKTTDGNFVIVGSTTSNTGDFATNHGGTDILVRKVTPTGTILWTKLLGGTSTDEGVGIAEDSDGGLVILSETFSNNGDVIGKTNNFVATWIFKINSSGTTILWQYLKDAVGNQNYATFYKAKSIIKSINGGFIVALDDYQNPSRSVPYLLRLSSLGSDIWGQQYDFDPYDVGYTYLVDLVEKSTGEIVALGTVSGYPSISNFHNPNFPNGPSSNSDVFLMKANSTGNLSWSKCFGGDLTEKAYDLEIDTNDYLYIASNSNSTNGDLSTNVGSSDAWIVKTSDAGTILWQNNYGTSNGDFYGNISTLSSGDVIVVGKTGYNVLLSKYSSSGTNIWHSSSYNLNNNSDFYPPSLMTQGNDTYVLANYYYPNDEIYLLKYGIAPPITIGTITPTSLCYGSNISVPFTTTLPSGTIYTIKLKKGTTTYQTTTGTTSPINIQVPYSSSIVYGTDYFVEVSSGANVSSPSNALTIGAIYGASLYDVVGNTYYGSTICNGSSLYIFAKASGYAGFANPNELTFKWYKNNVLIPSETNSSLLVNSAGSYYVVVSQGSCSYSSNSASISFSSSIYANNIYYGEPVACDGTTKRIEANFISNQASYQWYKDNVLISGATSKVYNASSSGLYNVKVTDGTCIAYSSQTRFTFLSGIPASLYVTANDTTICGSQSKYLQMNTYDSYATYQYQWQKNGVDISGATSVNYYANQAGKYRLKATQGSCISYTKEKEIIVATTAQKPVLTAPYTKICSGTLRIQSDVNSYWYKDGATLNYFSSSYPASSSGVYKQVVSAGTSCQSESNPVSITIGQLDKPQIKYVGSTNICGSSDYVFLYADNLNMSGTINRQWKKDGVNLSGQVYNSLYVYSPGTYTLVFTNGACSTESDPIVVTQTSPLMKIVNTDNTLFCSNRAVKLSVEGLGYNTTYSNNKIWHKDGILIPNETSNDIYITAAGVYTASINSNGCVGTSTPYEIKSGPPTGFTSDPIGVVNAGSTAQIHISNCVGDIKWYDVATGGSSISSANPFTTPALSQNTSYWVSCTKEYCESARVQVNVIVENPCPTEIIHNNTVTAKEYLTSGSIQSTVNLPTGVKYNVKTYVTLSPGFQVGSDEVFEAVIGGCEPAPLIPTNGLVAYYPFNGNANDESGNNFNGTVFGNPSFVTGTLNQAIRTSPMEGQYVQVPNNNTLQNISLLSISVWVKPTNFDLNCYTEREMIVGKGQDVVSNGYGISIQRNTEIGCGNATNFTSYKMNFEYGGSTISTPFYNVDNQWKYICATYDGSILKIFVNGVFVQQQTIGNVSVLNTLPMYFNYATWNGGGSNTNGRYGGDIDNIRIYNRELRNEEVLYIYNAEKP